MLLGDIAVGDTEFECLSSDASTPHHAGSASVSQEISKRFMLIGCADSATFSQYRSTGGLKDRDDHRLGRAVWRRCGMRRLGHCETVRMEPQPQYG